MISLPQSKIKNTNNENGCPKNVVTHIFPYNILVITILGKHFPQTRRSLDRVQAKACLLNKNWFCF